MPSMSIIVVTNKIISFFLVAEQHYIVCVYVYHTTKSVQLKLTYSYMLLTAYKAGKLYLMRNSSLQKFSSQ